MKENAEVTIHHFIRKASRKMLASIGVLTYYKQINSIRKRMHKTTYTSDEITTEASGIALNVLQVGIMHSLHHSLTLYHRYGGRKRSLMHWAIFIWGLTY